MSSGSRLERALRAGKFVVTAELNRPTALTRGTFSRPPIRSPR
jgi:hypothetical protein